MGDFSIRSNEVEQMDDLNCSGDMLRRTLRELEFINKWLGGNAVTISALSSMIKGYSLERPIHIADLGCGSGEMLRIIKRWATRNGIAVKLTGIDANPNIIALAKENLAGMNDVELVSMNIFSGEFQSKEYDVVIGTLFFHHFTATELVDFFKVLRQNLRVGLIINDIHRHYLAYHSIKYLTKAFSKSAMVISDAPLSVKRAFSRNELSEIVSKSGFTDYSIRWKWAFRWQVSARM